MNDPQSKPVSFAKRLIAVLVSVSGFTAATGVRADPTYQGSAFDQVWDQVNSDPYAKPNYEVTLSSLYGFGRNLILEAGKRTIASEADLLPHFNKLVHRNGVCLRGAWSITEASPYTGVFARGTRALMIARASSAFNGTDVDQYRAFGLAGKVFPTQNPAEVVKTANFFAIDDLAGTLTEHFLDANLTNEPAFTLRPRLIALAPIAASVSSAFALADSHPNLRQVYPLAEAGLLPTDQAVTPTWLQISGSADQPRVDGQVVRDFRDELLVTQYPERKIRFDIAVASEKNASGAKKWQKIGEIEFTESVVSDSCDHELHFHHPKFR